MEDQRNENSQCNEDGKHKGNCRCNEDSPCNECGPDDHPADSEEIGSLRASVVELKDKLLRAVAEIQNVQRRAEKERADAVKYGIAEFAKDILGIHDNLHRALESCGECSDSIADGIRLTILEMDRTLSRRGVVRIDSVGRKFDPHIHQALTEIEDPEVEPGTIVCVMQDGFMIHDRLLRPALVGVSRLPSGV